MEKSTHTYRGYSITEDKMLGYSLICPKGHWCCSDSTVDDIKKLVDRISEPNK